MSRMKMIQVLVKLNYDNHTIGEHYPDYFILKDYPFQRTYMAFIYFHCLQLFCKGKFRLLFSFFFFSLEALSEIITIPSHFSHNIYCFFLYSKVIENVRSVQDENMPHARSYDSIIDTTMHPHDGHVEKHYFKGISMINRFQLPREIKRMQDKDEF